MRQSTSTAPTTPTRHVDVAIIGAGSAGHSAFKKFIGITDDIVIINKGYWTTTCSTVGCMPSKLLVAAAERAHHGRHSQEFGIGTAQISNIDGAQVMRRVQQERDRFASYAADAVASWDDNKKIDGEARITADGYIMVNDALISAKYIIIATGTTPYIPDGWKQQLGNTLLTSDTVFELADLPKRLAVIGAGAIGIELAQAFNRLGVEVTLFNRANRIGGITDEAINQKAIECFGAEFTLELGSTITEVYNSAGVATITYLNNSGVKAIWQGDKVLVATGRRHTLDKLGIKNLGIELDHRLIPKNVNQLTGQIADSNIYIIGDTSTHLPVLHMANYVGKNSAKAIKPLITNDNAAAQNAPTFKPLTPITVVFCDPQIAHVGVSLQSLQQTYADSFDDNIVIGEVSFDNQGRSRIMGVNCGLMHIYAHKKTGRVMGAAMVAPDSEYMAHILATSISNALTLAQLLDTPFYHPTILEGLRTGLRNAYYQLELT